jgi:hypothetical protein
MQPPGAGRLCAICREQLQGKSISARWDV